MSLKTYLSKQIRLVTLTNFDVMTDEETELYETLLAKINEINAAEQNKEEENRKKAIEEKKIIQEQLENKIKEHDGTPREINLKHVLNSSLFEEDEEGNKIVPAGMTWDGLKPTRRIAEFCSEESRAMGLNHNDICWDKIVFKWKHETILKQIILDGLTSTISDEETGELIKKKYRFVTASAGQLRTDKVQLVEEKKWNEISGQLMCGMTWEKLNEHGGINLGKLMAYTALPCSATEISDINIDECIVIPDWEGERTGDLNYITQDYEIQRGIRTVPGINFIDGGGMALPGVVFCGNGMTRAPWIKGLLTTFDFIKFCKVHNVEPKINDVYGLEHDLVKENIKVLFTASQFKLWKHYNSWEHYKTEFKKNGCHICLTNYEEEWIKNSEINYQFLQSLDMTDEEIDLLCFKDLNRIEDMAENKEAMLQTLNARISSDKPYEQALALYPELLRDGQAKETLKAIKKRWTLDGASGCLRAENKRLYVIPDWYAACEFYFLHEEHPKGLLQPDEVFSKIHLKYDECDVLRSPSLSFEHAIRKFNKSNECKEWFTTKGVYVCYNDWMDRILQLDYDGDMLNILLNKEVIAAAKRRMVEFNFAPLFYDGNKAPAHTVSYESLYEAVILAHKYSGIGVFSNMITKLWNKDEPDPEAAGYICMTNNYTIKCQWPCVEICK